MSGDQDFDKADADAGVAVALPPESRSGTTALAGRLPSDIIAYRKSLVEKYHAGAPSFIERLRRAGKSDMESLYVSLMDEVLGETDHLLGNELIATQNGELRDASVISFKRAEVLEKALRAVQTKQQLKGNGFDVDAPEMMVVFRFFLAKVKETFDRIGVNPEIPDLFFRRFGEVTDNWQKELRERLDVLGTQR
jgi:hypothetical protein